MKLGIFSKQRLQTLKALGEEPADFDRLHEFLWQTLDPRDGLEEMLVEDMAELRWRRGRLFGAESKIWSVQQLSVDIAAGKESRKAETPPEEKSGSPLDAGKKWSDRYDFYIKQSHCLRMFVADMDGFNMEGLEYLEGIFAETPGVFAEAVIGKYATFLNEQDEPGVPATPESIESFRKLAEDAMEGLCNAVLSDKPRRRGDPDEASSSLDGRAYLDRIIRYESHLEHQFERKLQQLVSWRKARGESMAPRRHGATAA